MINQLSIGLMPCIAQIFFKQVADGIEKYWRKPVHHEFRWDGHAAQGHAPSAQ
jgi:hypothetical protein